jgi:hypothetical protein
VIKRTLCAELRAQNPTEKFMSNALKKVLFAREAPYVATLFVGLTAWILTHLAERLVQTPTLDYEATRQELSAQEKTDPRIFPPTNAGTAAEPVKKDVFQVTNISHSARFGKITFHLRFPPDSPGQEKMRFAWTTYNLPALPRTKAAGERKSEPAGCEESWAWFPIQELHPDWSIDLICFHTGEGVPGLGFSTEADTAIRLVEKGCTTTLVRHESEVLFGLLAASVSLMIVYLAVISIVTPPT